MDIYVVVFIRSMVARLERIPPEIWQEILSYACSDGGATGRALSRTSRYFHDQSIDCTFHSLEFRSTTTLIRFLVSLHAYPRECKLRHLLLEPSHHTDNVPRAFQSLAGMSTHRPGMVADQPAFCADIAQSLFYLAADYMRTLYMVHTPAIPFRPFAQTFPKLRELSVWNHPLIAPTGRLCPPAPSGGPPPQPLCPSLRRLHVILTDTDITFRHILARLPAFASSSLTHLRLSGVTYTETALPAKLAEMLGLPAPLPLRERLRLSSAAVCPPGDGAGAGAGSASVSASVPSPLRPGVGVGTGALVPRDATFPHLRFVVISAVQPRFDAEAGPEAAASWTALLGLLRELERTCKRVEGMRMVVLERSWMRKPSWGARLREDWLGRMRGAQGCWVGSEMEESEIEGPLERPKDVEW